jgi:CRP/FNR family transcriptional regulator, cyclic AMP receptor protein
VVHPRSAPEGLDETLAGTVLFQGLAPSAAIRLAALAQRCRVARGDIIFRRGEPGAAMYVILRGKVRIGRPAGPDRENLLTLLGPGELLGELTLFDPAPRKATATAVTDVELAVFTEAAVREWVATEPSAAWHFLQLMVRRLRRTNDALENLLFADVPRRVARTLLAMAHRFGDVTPEGIRVHHDLTQEQLAQHIGASRESVNKVLSDLANRLIVRLELRSVVILDIDRLQRKAS